MRNSTIIRALDRATSRTPANGHSQAKRGTEVQRAEETSRRIRRALNLGTGVDHSLRTAVELAQTLQLGVAKFSRNWADQSTDEIQALRNLSTSLESFARQISDDLAIALGVALDYRDGSTPPTHCDDPALEALAAEIFQALQRIAGSPDGAAPDDATGPDQAESSGRPALDPQLAADVAAALEEAVIVNRRTGIYHPHESAAAKRIAGRNRLLYASAEAAELDGFRASRKPRPAGSSE